MILLEKTIQHSLDLLKPNTNPAFGRMTPQHMVEHLIITSKLSVGKIQYPSFDPSQKALKSKELLLYTPLEMPMGLTAPNDSGQLLPLKHPSLEAAKDALSQAWREFKSYYEGNHDVKHVHPRFGMLDYNEWQRFHYKHVMHHFKQFGIWKK